MSFPKTMDFTDSTYWTETDPNSHISVSASTVTCSGLARNEDAYVYANLGQRALAEFTLTFSFNISSVDDYAIGLLSGVSNSLSSFGGWSSGYVTYFYKNTGGSGNLEFRIWDVERNVISSGITISTSTTYYVTVACTDSIYSAYLYSDSDRTALVGSRTAAISPNPIGYVYLYAASSWNSAESVVCSYTVSDLIWDEDCLDLTDFTEVDGGGTITVYPSVYAVTSLTRNVDSYIYYDMGAGNINDFQYKVHTRNASTDEGVMLFFGVSNDIDDAYGWTNGILCYNYDYTGVGMQWKIGQDGGSFWPAAFTDLGGVASNDDFWCIVTRKGQRVTLDVYRWPDYQAKAGSASIFLSSTNDISYRYLYTLASYNTGSAAAYSSTGQGRIQLITTSPGTPDIANWRVGPAWVEEVRDVSASRVPTFDNGSVDDTLTEWKKIKRKIDESIEAGSYFSSSVPISQTFSLIKTSSTNTPYVGGVLNHAGDIHFCPSFAAGQPVPQVGQKVNTVTGIASTYSLAYTSTAGLYVGGCLDSNGYIHFAPAWGARGQKVSPSGVCSTYSLVYTNSGGAYYGAALDPNGTIHFAPLNAPVGQKVDKNGTVSTYSLVYTVAAAYFGAVLSPTGDIHFVPRSAAVGQKVSPDGTVSTYSLIYTLANAYFGGCLDSEGSIHFIPYAATVGQKVAIDGTVSTYTLAHTTSSAYYGGALYPDGSIHFTPSGAAVGQKVDVNGVCSTYPLVYTIANVHSGGGIVDQYGNMTWAPNLALYGVRMSMGLYKPWSHEVCLSPFFNKAN